jgi:ribosomal protein S18 acetylase RimI-like enzyme
MIKVTLQDKHLIEAIAAMARDIWREHYASIISAEQIEYMLDNFQSYRAIENQIKTGELAYYIVDCGGEYAGYFAIAPKDGTMFLSKLYIYKNFRRKGLARKAVNFVSNLAKQQNLSAVTLTVAKNNAPSIAAYNKMGFVKDKDITMDIGGGFVMDDFYLKLNV